MVKKIADLLLRFDWKKKKRKKNNRDVETRKKNDANKLLVKLTDFSLNFKPFFPRFFSSLFTINLYYIYFILWFTSYSLFSSFFRLTGVLSNQFILFNAKVNNIKEMKERKQRKKYQISVWFIVDSEPLNIKWCIYLKSDYYFIRLCLNASKTDLKTFRRF